MRRGVYRATGTLQASDSRLWSLACLRVPRLATHEPIGNPRRTMFSMQLKPAVQGMAWMILSGAIFGVLNALLRVITLQLPPIEAQFLRYVSGALVMLPFILRVGFRAYHPNGLIGQLWRGAAHTSGMLLWFMALPHLPLAETTAIGFTGPIFVMIGAVLVFHEPMLWRRWVSALIGFAGVLIVVWPKLSGSNGFYDLVMLGSAPLFAASQLITKALTRRDRTEVIVVWQCLTISLFSFPLAMLHWVWPMPMHMAVVPGRRRAGQLRALLRDTGLSAWRTCRRRSRCGSST